MTTTPTIAQAGLPELPDELELSSSYDERAIYGYSAYQMREYALAAVRAAQAAQPAPDLSGIHSCGWHCDNPACIKAQRDEMRGRLEAQAAATVDEAIAALVVALKQSKGWLHDYADSVIRDAIDRTQPERNPLSDAEIETLAHRMASTYTHRTDPTSHAYGFVRHTLIDFVRAIERLHGIRQGGEA